MTQDGGDTTIVKVPGKIEFNEYVPINGGYYGSVSNVSLYVWQKKVMP